MTADSFETVSKLIEKQFPSQSGQWDVLIV